MMSQIPAEILKLRRSLVLLLVLGIPAVVLVLLVAIVATGNGPDDWQRLTMSGCAIWAYFLLPMTATAFTALQAQVEHASGGWTHALSSPRPRWTVLGAKAVVALMAMLIISIGVGLAIATGGTMAAWLAPEHALAGQFSPQLAASLLLRMWLAGFLLVALQFVAATAVASFAVPVVLGIMGTFVATIATSAKAGIYFPWLLPTNILASDPARAAQALWGGLVAGVIVFAVGCVWLARRDWR